MRFLFSYSMSVLELGVALICTTLLVQQLAFYRNPLKDLTDATQITSVKAGFFADVQNEQRNTIERVFFVYFFAVILWFHIAFQKKF